MANLLDSESLLNVMHKYQEDNDIKEKCMTNCQTFYDIIKSKNIGNIRIEACICVGYNIKKGCKEIVDKHFIVKVNGEIKDPSYCVNALENKEYFFNFIDFKKKYPELKIDMIKFIEFVKLSEMMNNNEFKITDLKYYNDQFDFIENSFK
tara:strand:+ start:2986 stop:3435 length:450 start_codon:yes stop_codon:yes gene_type:complete